MAEAETRKRGQRKTRNGTVVSRSGDKSIIVRVETRKRHPLYGKFIRKFKKFHVHDQENLTGVNDRVCIVETKPISKLKRWRLLKILEKRS